MGAKVKDLQYDFKSETFEDYFCGRPGCFIKGVRLTC